MSSGPHRTTTRRMFSGTPPRTYQRDDQDRGSSAMHRVVQGCATGRGVEHIAGAGGPEPATGAARPGAVVSRIQTALSADSRARHDVFDSQVHCPQWSQPVNGRRRLRADATKSARLLENHVGLLVNSNDPLRNSTLQWYSNSCLLEVLAAQLRDTPFDFWVPRRGWCPSGSSTETVAIACSFLYF